MDFAQGQLINGTWRKGCGSDVIANLDPATEDTLAETNAASAADTQDESTLPLLPRFSGERPWLVPRRHFA